MLPYLAVSLEPVEPAARLRAAVIAAAQADLAAHPRSAVTAERRVTTIHGDALVAAPQDAEEEDADVAGDGVVVRIASARRSRKRRALAWATRVAAAVAVVGVALYGFGVINEPKASNPNRWEVISPDSKYAVLTSQGNSQAGGVIALRSTGHLLVYVNGLEPTKGDQVYMVWITAGGNPIAAGYFAVNDQRDGQVEVDSVPKAPSLWVTVCLEPNDQVTTPTGPVVASGTIFR